MKIITALENPKTNEKLKKETDFEIIGNDIQYQEGIIEILEKNLSINLIIISELLPGEIGFKKIIEKIKVIKKEIEIRSLKTGECLMFAGEEHMLTKIECSDFEENLIK